MNTWKLLTTSLVFYCTTATAQEQTKAAPRADNDSAARVMT
jgi:hypothetical protein